jgi:PAS domain S-box-containing protein
MPQPEHGAGAQQARERALAAHAMDIVGILNAEGRISYVSPSVQRVLGYTPEEVCGQNGFTFMHPDDMPRLEQAVATLLQAPGTVVQTVARFRHRDGSWRTFEVINSNHLDDPAIRGLIFNERDITERVQAEEALRASEARFRALSEHATDLVAILGPEGTYCYLSPSWQRVLGYAPDELLGRSGFDLIHPEDIAGLQAALVPLQQEPGGLATGRVPRAPRRRLLAHRGGGRDQPAGRSSRTGPVDQRSRHHGTR